MSFPVEDYQLESALSLLLGIYANPAIKLIVNTLSCVGLALVLEVTGLKLRNFTIIFVKLV